MSSRAESYAAGLGMAVLVVGVTVLLLTAPSVTDVLVRAYDGAGRSGLSESDALEAAQAVRAFVTDQHADPLPGIVAGRQGFTPGAVAHLMDVRRVLAAARLATGVVASLLTVWLAVGIARQRRAELAAGMRTGAILLAAVVPVAALAALLDFDRFFAGFHSLFFASGTWQFTAEELMIQLFPEPFWVTAAASWALLVLLGALALGLGSRIVARPHDGARRVNT